MSSELPVLSEKPIHHPGCCLSISSSLLIFLHNALIDITSARTHCDAPGSKNADRRIVPGLQRKSLSTCLSIGSGTGLLEVLLQQHITNHPPCGDRDRSFLIRGLEVVSADTINRYLPQGAFDVVPGAWATSDVAIAPEVEAWLFVYPRQPSLVAKYVAMVQAEQEQASHLMLMIWAGPIADWNDYGPVFEDLEFRGWSMKLIHGSSCGLSRWECLTLIERQALS